MPPKKSKRESSDSDDEEVTPPPSKVKKTKNSESNDHAKIPAIYFLEFVHDLQEYGKEKLAKLHGKPDIAKLADSIPMLQKHHDLYSQPNFNSEFNALYVTAARRKNVSVDLAVNIIGHYLNDGQTVEDFPGFPKTPSRPINAYISENRDIDHASLDDIVKLRKEFASGSVDTKPYVEAYTEECRVYIEKLKKYLEKHTHQLGESHIAYVNNLISKTSKSINAPGSSQKKPKKEKKTAFDWYKDANPDLYAGKDEETRIRKLQRKFDKLDDAERRIYENIAAKNS